MEEDYKDLVNTIRGMYEPPKRKQQINEDLFENQREHAMDLLMDAGYKQTGPNVFEHPHGHRAEFKHTIPHPFVVHFSHKSKLPHRDHAMTIEHPYMTKHAIKAMQDFVE